MKHEEVMKTWEHKTKAQTIIYFVLSELKLLYTCTCRNICPKLIAFSYITVIVKLNWIMVLKSDESIARTKGIKLVNSELPLNVAKITNKSTIDVG